MGPLACFRLNQTPDACGSDCPARTGAQERRACDTDCEWRIDAEAINEGEAAPCLEARLDRLAAVVDWLEATIGRLDVVCHGLDRFDRTMRWGILILTVMSLASMSLTVDLALQVGRCQGSSPRARVGPDARLQAREAVAVRA